jgi:hypothetical protein
MYLTSMHLKGVFVLLISPAAFAYDHINTSGLFTCPDDDPTLASVQMNEHDCYV